MGALPAPILMVGAGHMGGALIDGWQAAGAYGATDLILWDPRPGEAALAAERDGALLNPPPDRLAAAQVLVMAVKPQLWRAAAGEIAHRVVSFCRERLQAIARASYPIRDRLFVDFD